MNKPLVILTNLLAAIAPYFTFMEYHDYPYLSLEATVYFLCFAGVGLGLGVLAANVSPRRAVIITAIVLFFSYDFQFNNSLSSNIIVVFYMVLIVFLLRKLKTNGYKICCAALVAFILSTLVVGVEDVSSDVRFAAKASQYAKGGNKPVIVHIVLDEHIGLNGVPPNQPGGKKFIRAIRSSYEKLDYTLFENAYSEHSYTRFSLALAFNNVAEIQQELQLNKNAAQWMSRHFMLAKNSYLKEMSKRGYRIFIRQSSYLNFCAAQDVTYTRCQTYDFGKLQGVAKTDLSLGSKMLLFASFHIQNTRTRINLITLVRGLEISWSFLFKDGDKSHQPNWVGKLVSWERPLIGALSHANALDQLGDAVVKAEPGDLYFAHLLQPHFPYVYNADCQVRPVSQWIHRGTNIGYNRNDQDLRNRIYSGYFSHTLCVNQKIKNFTERLKKAGVLDNTVIVVHGDHGSRILVNELQPDEYNDPVAHREAHSTLFAVRIPGKQAPNRKHAASISAILWELIDNGFSTIPPDTSRGALSILVPNAKLQKYTRIKYLGEKLTGE